MMKSVTRVVLKQSYLWHISRVGFTLQGVGRSVKKGHQKYQLTL